MYIYIRMSTQLTIHIPFNWIATKISSEFVVLEISWEFGIIHNPRELIIVPLLDHRHHQEELQIVFPSPEGKENRKSCRISCYRVLSSVAAFKSINSSKY